jgi:arylsulfatase A-like enzyme
MLLTAFFIGGCSGSPYESLDYRFIPSEPEAYLEDHAWRSYEEVLTWSFEDPSELGSWSVNAGAGKMDLGERGLAISLAHGKVKLARAVAINTASAPALEIELDHEEKVHVAVYWAREGEDFSPERSISKKLEPRGDVEREILDLSSHALWSGDVKKIRIDFRSPSKTVAYLKRISALRAAVSTDGLTAVLDKAWKVILNDETRNAVVGLPGIPVERTVDIPPDATLRFAFGVQSGVTVPLRFLVNVTGPSGVAQAAFASTIDPANEDQVDAWHEEAVDLRRFAGPARVVSLVTEADAAVDPAAGLAFWANPQIVRSRRREEAPNVVVISIDTLRADRMSLYGHSRPTTPNLDDWARRHAVVFENTVAPAPWTLPSHVSLFSGLDALSHGVNFNYPAPPNLRFMAEILRENGYKTMAVTGGGWIGNDYGLSQGFDVFRPWPRATAGVQGELRNGVSTAVEWLQESTLEPFFLFFHTFEVHSPHIVREPYFSRFSGEPAVEASISVTEKPRPIAREEGFLVKKDFFIKGEADVPPEALVTPGDYSMLRDLYDSGVAYTDAELAGFLEYLESSGLIKRTWVVITSDHGEALGERDLASHGYLYDFNLMVPLVISAPGAEPRRIARQVRIVDIMPTILAAAGLSPPGKIDGVSLLPLIAGGESSVPSEAWAYASSSNFGIALRVANRLKYIYNDTAWSAVHAQQELYDLTRDAGEETNIAADYGQAQELREHVRQRLAASGQGIKVELRNAELLPYSGYLEGPQVHHFKVKSAQLPPDAVTFVCKGTLRFVVPAETSYSLLLTNPSSATLKLTIDGGGSADLSETIDLRADAGFYHVERSGGAWTRRASASVPPATGITISFPESAPISEEDPAETNTELREQLRALGYVQ